MDKQEQFNRAREQDKVFIEAETRKLAQDEQSRAQHFLKMKDFQIRNEQKLQALSNYQAQGNIGEAARRDEELMLKQMAEREAREALDSQRRRDVDIRSKTEASQALRL